MPQVNAEA